MDKESLNNFKTLIEQRRQSLEVAPDPTVFATDRLKKTGYLTESGRIATQFQSQLIGKLLANRKVKVSSVKSPPQIRQKTAQSILPVVVSEKVLQEPNVEYPQNRTNPKKRKNY